MADYTKMKEVWPSLAGGADDAKLATLLEMRVSAGKPQRAIVTANQIINCITAEDFSALTADQALKLNLLLAGGEGLDASPGTSVRQFFEETFTGKSQTIAKFSELVEPFDNPTVPWWSMNGFLSPPGLGDVIAAGLAPKIPDPIPDPKAVYESDSLEARASKIAVLKAEAESAVGLP